LAFLTASLGIGCAEAATWYVAPTGSDSSACSQSAPCKTWQKAIDRAGPGDIVAIRPGTYAVSGSKYYGARVTRDGTSAAPITLRGDGGRPVLDCSKINYNSNIYCFSIEADWWKISDIVVTGAKQPKASTYPSGIFMWDANNNVVENVETYENQGTGIRIVETARNNLLKNCDSHHNYNAKDGGGNADGIALSYLSESSTGNRVVGCRAWSNSDDGFDLWSSDAPVTIEDSWSFRNGYVPGTTTAAGNGNGFKLGISNIAVQHRIIGNLAFENRQAGFVDNGARGALYIANNTSWKNVARSYQFSQKLAHALVNNVAVGGSMTIMSSAKQTTNSWQMSSPSADRDFLSTSTSGVDGPRLSDGSLPPLSFLRLAEQSKLIDKGTGIAGRPFSGAAPDLGAYESGAPQNLATASAEQDDNSPSRPKRRRGH
jgi:parallel beta-helix repeat protein